MNEKLKSEEKLLCYILASIEIAQRLECSMKIYEDFSHTVYDELAGNAVNADNFHDDIPPAFVKDFLFKQEMKTVLPPQ